MAVPGILMSRVGYTAARMAGVLAGLEVGDRIPKMHDLAKELGCGKGTVQAAFGLLDGAGALKLRSKGHLGTFVEAIDHRLLWQLAGDRSVSLAMPLPYTRRYEGLATGLYAGFQERGIPLSLVFMRGSVARLRALREMRTDYVLMSSLAASVEPDLDIVHDYGDGTYVESHVIVVAAGRDPQDPSLRVAVDPTSADVVTLVRQVFGDVPPERLVEVSYNHLDHGFRAGTIDATVWNADEIRTHISAPIDVYPLPDSVDPADTRAVIVRLRTDDPVPVGVREALASPLVAERARDVIAGRATPTY